MNIPVEAKKVLMQRCNICCDIRRLLRTGGSASGGGASVPGSSSVSGGGSEEETSTSSTDRAHRVGLSDGNVVVAGLLLRQVRLLPATRDPSPAITPS